MVTNNTVINVYSTVYLILIPDGRGLCIIMYIPLQYGQLGA